MFYQINKNSGLFQTHVFVTHVFVTLSQNAVSNQLKCLVLSTKCVFPMLSPSAASFKFFFLNISGLFQWNVFVIYHSQILGQINHNSVLFQGNVFLKYLLPKWWFKFTVLLGCFTFCTCFLFSYIFQCSATLTNTQNEF